MGTHTNKRDAKGRVSIPAPFRAVLKPDGPGSVQLILRASHNHACIEGWPQATFAALATPLDSLDTFSQTHEDLAVTLYAGAYTMESDKEGRIQLPDELIAHAHLSDSIVFMGLGRTFQIWEPGAAEKRLADAREQARTRALTLPGTRA